VCLYWVNVLRTAGVSWPGLSRQKGHTVGRLISPELLVGVCRNVRDDAANARTAKEEDKTVKVRDEVKEAVVT